MKKKVLSFLLMLCGLWTGGYVWFVVTMPSATQLSQEHTDAIVVLTGSRGRVEEGLFVLKQGWGKALFISGVHPGVVQHDLLPPISREKTQPPLAIELGYAASNTTENAREVAQWMARKNYHSLRLVTADYHMRRSLLELRGHMPEIKIIPHPVTPAIFSHADFAHQMERGIILVREYNKLLGATLRMIIQKGFSQ